MRLDVLNRGYGPGTKLLFALIRLFSRNPVPDAAKLVFYRPDFYGSRAKEFTHEAMRGPSAWSVGDRELMAAYVSQGERVRVLHRRAQRDRTAGIPGRAEGRGGAGRPGIGPRRGRAPGNATDARQADPGGKGGRRGHAASAVRRCLTPSRSGTRWRSAPRSTRPTGSPTPSASRCSAPRASRQEPSTCSSGVTGSAFSFTGAADASIGLVPGGVLTQAACWHWIFFVSR